MANKAVLLTAGVGLAVYYASESLKDRQVEREAEEARQQTRDMLEAMERRRAEEQYKSKGRVRDFEKGEKINSEIRQGIDNGLFELVLKVEERLQQSDEPSRLLTLPFLSASNKSSEVLLGAAIALCDHDIIRAIQLRIKHAPGLGLATLSKDWILLIQNVFKQQNDFGLTANQILILLVCSSKCVRVKSGGTVAMVLPPDPECQNSLGFQTAAEMLGFHVASLSHFQNPSQTRVSQSRVKYNRIKSATGEALSLDKEPTIISNCRIQKFSVPLESNGESCYVDLFDINILSHGTPKRPSIPKVAQFLASCLVAKRAKVASERLEYLLRRVGSAKGVSFEHIAAYCGFDSDLIEELANGDITMIEQNNQKIADTITSMLVECVPSPDRSIQSSSPPTAALLTEISTFVETYLHLLKFAYFDIPRLAGSPPSAFVHDKRVSDDAENGVFVGPPARLVLGIKRTMEQNERDRIVRSRELAAPGDRSTAIFVTFLFLVMFWLSYIPFKMLLSRQFAWPVSVIMGVLMVRSLLQVVKAPLHVSSKDKTDGELADLWNVAQSCTEVIARKTAIVFGEPTPFEKKLLQLKTSCREQYRIWSRRIATKDYYESLRRKRITYNNFLLLLDGLVDTKTSACKEKYEEVILPGSLEEADEFLAVEIEQEDQDEAATSSLEAFLKLGSVVESSLKFSVGDRVIVEPPAEERFDGTSDSGLTALSTHSGLAGSVVESYPGIVLVHIDGSSSPVAVPSSYCSVKRSRKYHAPLARANDSRDTIRTEDEPETNEPEAKRDIADEQDERKRARTVEEALEDGGWTLVRWKNHKCYRRILDDGTTQNFTMSKTPSDFRAKKKALATIRKLNASSSGPNDADTGASSGKTLCCTLCCICKQEKPESEFSKSQLQKARHKCKQCVESTLKLKQ